MQEKVKTNQKKHSIPNKTVCVLEAIAMCVVAFFIPKQCLAFWIFTKHRWGGELGLQVSSVGCLEEMFRV